MGALVTPDQFREFLDDNIASHPAEATTVRKVWKALKDAGDPIVAVFDGEERTPARKRRDVLDLVFNLDMAWLYTDSGCFVLIVNGNGWDALSDYSVELEDVLKPVLDYIVEREYE